MRKEAIIIIFFLMISLSGCAEVRDDQADEILQDMTKEQMRPDETAHRAELTAEDGTRLAASYYDRPSTKGIILLHMLNGNRNDWHEFAKYMKDYQVIAPDFRGHGESEGNLREFSENDYSNMVLDAKAAGEYLKSRGVEELYSIGASIGANIALQYGIQEDLVKKVVMLSPGLDYKGVTSENINDFDRPAYIITSSEDTYSAESSKELYGLATDPKKLEIYSDIGHGTTMLEKRPELMQEIKAWIEKGG
ncbi:alpha/beta fold hydrolase [Candidatus Woesearchaeota archaeon]|nr:alpha/beta fold hydrolase [Candidatus Woesearchaeota archaeon]